MTPTAPAQIAAEDVATLPRFDGFPLSVGFCDSFRPRPPFEDDALERLAAFDGNGCVRLLHALIASRSALPVSPRRASADDLVNGRPTLGHSSIIHTSSDRCGQLAMSRESRSGSGG
jgi:hypothetical protein